MEPIDPKKRKKDALEDAFEEVVGLARDSAPDFAKGFPDMDIVTVMVVVQLAKIKPDFFKYLIHKAIEDQITSTRIGLMNAGYMDVLVDGEGVISLARTEKYNKEFPERDEG